MSSPPFTLLTVWHMGFHCLSVRVPFLVCFLLYLYTLYATHASYCLSVAYVQLSVPHYNVTIKLFSTILPCHCFNKEQFWLSTREETNHLTDFFVNTFTSLFYNTSPAVHHPQWLLPTFAGLLIKMPLYLGCRKRLIINRLTLLKQEYFLGS